MILIEASSTNPRAVERIQAEAKEATSVLVMLDSNHTHQHVLDELGAYAELVTLGSYCIVFDTVVEYIEKAQIGNRPWGKGNSPMSAVDEFMQENRNFVRDRTIEQKLGITVATGGYLRKVPRDETF